MTRNAIVLIENGFEDSEFLYPYYRMQEAGFEVKVVGPKADTKYTGKNGVVMKSNAAANEVSMDDHDVLIVPGGQAPDKMRLDQDMVRLVKEAFTQEKAVAAICHAAQLLVEADVLDGRTLTCWPSVKTDVKNAGGTYEDKEVVVDHNLVTSRKPADLPAFMRELLTVAGQKRTVTTKAS